jgi:hypothetical protein
MEQNKAIPTVTAAEVANWEDNFRKTVSTLVKFDKQDNGHSMKFYSGQSGVDAYWSGTIILRADNYLKWNYSLLNGVFMDAKMSLDDTNHLIPGNLYDFYKSWQEEVSKTMTEPGEGDETPDTTPATAVLPNLSGPETNNLPKPNTSTVSEGFMLKRKLTRRQTVMNDSERMRRLAGL